MFIDRRKLCTFSYLTISQKKDIETAGGKGANLGEMTRAGIPVPPGAVLTAQAYQRFMEFNQINVSDKPDEIRNAIITGNMPEDVQKEIAVFYRELGEKARVAVRSSATAEDLEDASFAGQQKERKKCPWLRGRANIRNCFGK